MENMFVKIKNEITEETVDFEVLTRSPFNGYYFTLDKSTFLDLFSCATKDMINTNISNDKENIYGSIDKHLAPKMFWWNYHVGKISDVYDGVEKSLEAKVAFADYRDEYREKFDADAFIFFKDYTFFRKLFNTSEEIFYEESV